MSYCIKFSTFLLLFSFNISAHELTINLSGQTKEGVLSLAIYNNTEAFNYSVKGEKRSEEGIFAGIETFIELKESHDFIIDLPELGGSNKIEEKGIEVQSLCYFEGH